MNIYIKISENQKTLSGQERWNSYDKRMILKKCWLSLMTNVESDDSINIYYHDVRDSTLKWLSDNCSILHNFIESESTNQNFLNPLIDIESYIKEEIDDTKLIAYLDDDYLWNKNAFNLIKEAGKYWKGFILANDSPKNYIKNTKSYVFVGIDRHWKTSSSANWNIIGSSFIFKKYITELKELSQLEDKNTINNLLSKTEFINPLPGVATHCDEKDMTPLVDWNYIWNGINI